MATDLLKQSLNIIRQGTKDFAADYTSNVKTIFEDAKSIRDNMTTPASTVRETYARIKSNGLSKMASDWFYQRESDTEGFDDSSDFDSGMDDNSDSPSVSTDSLNADQMRDITRGQMNAVYGSAGRISEINTANTAEVINSITNSASTIVASINNVNTTLAHISSQFDTFMKYHASVQQALSDENQKKLVGGNVNPASYNGAISISSVMAAAKSNTGGAIGTASSLGSMAKTMMGSMTPASLVSEALKGLAGKIKVPSTNETISEIGTKFNDAVADISHNILSDLIESPGFKKLFGDLTKMTANRDYSDIAVNSYSTKPAVFDGMTRYSIINTIPEYLKKINESISGQTWNVNGRGELTKGPVKNTFNEVTQSSFQSSGMKYNTQVSLANEAKAIDVNISSADIDMAGRALTMACVMYLHNVAGKNQLRIAELSSINMYVISNATSALKGADPSKNWTQICMGIMQRLESNTSEGTAFVKNVNSSLQSMIHSAEVYATTNPFALKNVGHITNDMARNEFIDANKSQDNNKNISKSNTHVIDSQIGTKKSNQPMFDMTDYIRGTFDVLNRGINVRVTNDVSSDTSGFDPYILRKNPTGSPSSSSRIQNNANDNSSNESDSYLDKMRNALIPKEIRLGMQFFGNAKRNIQGAAGEIKDKFNEKREENGGDNLVNHVANFASPAANKAVGIGKNIVNKVSGVANNVVDNVLGTKVTDLNGNSTRRGGIINNVKSATSAVIEGYNAERDMKKLKKSMDNGESDVSASDQVMAQQVFALMQAATADGDTTEDIGPIMSAINQIKDEGLRGKLESNVSAMLKRSNAKAQIKSNPLMKVLSFAKLGLLKIVSPVITVLRTIGLTIKTIGGKIVKFLGRIIKGGLSDMKTGAVAVGRSLFGQREKTDADGNIIQEKQIGLITQIALKPMKKTLDVAAKTLSKVFSMTKTFYSKMFDFSKKLGGGLLKGVKKLGKSIKEKFADSTLGQKLGGLKDKFMDKFDSSGGKSAFMAGFTNVFKEAKANRDKMKAKRNLETASDVATDEMSQMLSGQKESLVSKIGNWVEGIFNKITGTDGSESTADEQGKTVQQVEATTTEQEVGHGLTMTTNTSPDKTGTGTAVGSETKAITVTKGGAAGKTGGVLSKVKGLLSGGGAAAGAEGAAGAAGLAGKLGGLLGGLSVGILGLIKVIAAAVAGLSGFKELTSMFSEILQNSVKPLNKMFRQLIKVLKPIVKTVTKILTQVFECINSIMMSIIDTIQPLIESIEPIISAIFTALEPILSLVSVLVKIIMAPLMGVMKFVVVPILRQVGNTLEIISGILQFATGVIMTVLGSILTGIGTIIKILPFGGGSGILETGKQMASSGASMTKSGLANIASGAKKYIAGALDPLNISGVNSEDKDETKKEETKPKENDTSTGGSAMDGIVGNGDTYNDNSVHNIYGGGNITTNQTSYGNHMNMKDRGCGPSALADAYARRTGKSINPARVAASMSRHGTYDPNRGTSVGGFVAAGNAAGMNLRTGNVTRQSLKRATPNNPVTVVGSGPDFATKSGNIHYMNVVGSDKSGAVYVSNPLNGNVRRRPLDSVLHSSVTGIYGSGDSDDVTSGYQFDDSVNEAMNNLSDIAGSLLGIFTGKTDEDEANDLINAEKDKEATKQAQITLGDDYEKYESKGFDLFKKDYPKRDGESDEDYQKRYEKVKDKYTTLAAKDDVIKKNNELTDGINKAADTTDKASTAAAAATYDAGAAMAEGGSSGTSSGDGSGSGEFKSSNGVKLGVTYTPTITENDLTKGGNRRGQSFLHEFFKNTSGAKEVYSYPSYGFYTNRSTPDKNGKGSSGENHMGVDIIYNEAEGGFPIISTVDGTVSSVSSGGINDNNAYTGENGGMGNEVSIRDSANVRHRFMHMKDTPLVKVGEKVVGGKTKIGSVGTTGASSCYHLHYDITKQAGEGYIPRGSADAFNPFTYFKWEPGSGGATGEKIKMSSNMDKFSEWGPAYEGKPGLPKFIDAGLKAGLNYEEIASMIGVGVHENSGKKIFGEQSIVDQVTNSCGTFGGIMNWNDFSTSKYGETLEEQLGYVNSIYFDKNSNDYRAKTRNKANITNSFKELTGNDLTLDEGTRFASAMTGPKMVEADTWFIGGALVPGCEGSASGLGAYVGTAADAYNWMIDKGYIKTKKESTTSGSSSASGAIKNAVENVANYVANANTTTMTKNKHTGEYAIKDPYTKATIKYSSSKMKKLCPFPTVGLKLKSENTGYYTYTVDCNYTPAYTKVKLGLTKKWYVIRGNAPTSVDTIPASDDNTTSSSGSFSNSTSSSGTFGNGDVGDDFIVNDYYNNDSGYDDIDNIIGNGDMEDVFPVNDFVGNMYNNGVDDNIITDDYSYDDSNVSTPGYVYEDISNTPTTVIQNKYEIGAHKGESRARLTAILNNTYNIRSTRIEALLKKMIVMMDQKTSVTSTPTKSSGSQSNLFNDNEIPQSVSQLSIG